MKVLVTGATGFIGHYVIRQLLERQVEVVATSTSSEKARQKPWFSQVQFVEHDIHTITSEDLFAKFHRPDVMIHLAWGGLMNFKDEAHAADILPLHKKFLENIIAHGLKDLMVTGTCLEYGMVEGELSEDMEPEPTIAYPIAKNQLRLFLNALQKQHPFRLKWMRLFYLYGEGQSPKSILSQLQRAIDNNEPVFNMSLGEQERDYLPVSDVARNIILFALQQEITGIVNCCSGEPITIKQLVADFLNRTGQSIALNLGYYPYTDYEPMRFWGSTARLRSLKAG